MRYLALAVAARTHVVTTAKAAGYDNTLVAVKSR